MMFLLALLTRVKQFIRTSRICLVLFSQIGCLYSLLRYLHTLSLSSMPLIQRKLISLQTIQDLFISIATMRMLLFLNQLPLKMIHIMICPIYSKKLIILSIILMKRDLFQVRLIMIAKNHALILKQRWMMILIVQAPQHSLIKWKVSAVLNKTLSHRLWMTQVYLSYLILCLISFFCLCMLLNFSWSLFFQALVVLIQKESAEWVHLQLIRRKGRRGQLSPQLMLTPLSKSSWLMKWNFHISSMFVHKTLIQLRMTHRKATHPLSPLLFHINLISMYNSSIIFFFSSLQPNFCLNRWIWMFIWFISSFSSAQRFCVQWFNGSFCAILQWWSQA